MANDRKLRAASVGYEFRDPRVEDIEFGSNQTLLGYETVLMNIDGLNYLYDNSGRTYLGHASLGERASFRIREDAKRRKRELLTLLELGGTLILFLPAPEFWYVDSGNREYSGTGRNRTTMHLVEEMNLLSTLPFSITTEVAVTQDLELRVGDPFASFWKSNHDYFETAAVLTEQFGETTLVISGTNEIASSIAEVEKGLVISLPQVVSPQTVEGEEGNEDGVGNEDETGPDPEDVAFLDSLFDLVRALRTTSGDFEQPEWAEEYRLPGETDARERVLKANKRVARGQQELDRSERDLALHEQRKILVTGTGAALEALVEEAFVALGFDVEEGRPGRSDRIARSDGQTAVLEIKGLSKSAGERDAAQLEKWVNEHYLEYDEKVKGILVVNGWRGKPLEQRPKPVFPDQMLKYSESRGHCLISGLQLLGAWVEAEQNPGLAEDIRESILSSTGRYARYSDWAAFIERHKEVAEGVE